MLVNEKHLAELNSPIQKINSRVELHRGSTLEQICTCNDYVSNFTVERIGEGKFFGYGICHKLNINFIDINRELNLTNIDYMEVTFGVGGEFIYPFPIFYISEVTRNETTNEINVIAYDALWEAANHTVGELSLFTSGTSYTVKEFAKACATLLGMPMRIIGVDDASFDTYFAGGANFDGTEKIREALNAIAEATQTIYYMSGDWELTFKRLDKSGPAVLTIDKSKYIELTSGASYTLGGIMRVTELGDNVHSPATLTDTVVYIRNNPFWEDIGGRNTDIQTLLNNAFAAINGLTINPFECSWLGNYLLEIGDKIALTAEDNSEIYTYVVDDSISFSGILEQYSKWEYVKDEAETESNPTSLGELLNQTFARVDKINQEIELYSSKTEDNTSSIAQLQLNTDGISTSVSRIDKTTQDLANEINDKYETLSKEVSLKMSSEDVIIAINSELENGVDKVKTSTGFTFNHEGLTVSKEDSEISTQITEDGMTVTKLGEEVLVANNEGVVAKDLHANTYLWIGNHSRFEDQGSRTACFWVDD